MEKRFSLGTQLPPGFRFHPSDEELIVHYLRNKVTSSPLPGSFIAEIDLYKYNPWDLPKKALFGEEEWFFFTPRDRKYPNGVRPNRAAGSGYWKATGTDKPILTAVGMKSIGVKKALVFYQGRPPKGSKTDWIMDEYRLLDSIIRNSKRKGSMRLDDWVLCRVRQKLGSPRSHFKDRKETETETDDEPVSSEKETADPAAAINHHKNFELVKSYLYNEFPMLPYIFASLNFPPNVNLASSTSFQCSDDKMPCSSYHEDNADIIEKLTSPTTGTESTYNPLKRKYTEETKQELKNISSKTVLRKEEEDSGKEEIQTPANHSTLKLICSAADECGDYNFNDFDNWSFNAEYDQELNDLEFTKSM